MNSDVREDRWHVDGALLLFTQYRFITLVQRISKCGKIRKATLTPDKVLDALIYGSSYTRATNV